MLNHIKKLCLTFYKMRTYRMQTNLSPLWVMKKYGSSKVIEGKPLFLFSLVMGGRRASIMSFQNYIESTPNLLNSIYMNFLYALGTIPFGMLGLTCLKPII